MKNMKAASCPEAQVDNGMALSATGSDNLMYKKVNAKVKMV